MNSENIPVNIYALMESSDSGRLREIAGLFDADSRLMRNWIGLGGAELRAIIGGVPRSDQTSSQEGVPSDQDGV